MLEMRKILHQYYPLLALVIVFLIYSTPYVLQSPLCSVHLWRQTDSLSFCRYYYENGLKFFDTGIQAYLFKDFESNKTIGEFPIVYYLTACIWKITGENLWVLRVITLTLFSMALYSTFRAFRLLGVSRFYSTFSLILACTSPAVVIYSTNFLPDMHAVSISLIASFFYIRFVIFQRIGHWWISLLLFCLAALIKPTAVIPFGVIGLLWILDITSLFRLKTHQLFPSLLITIMGFFLVFVVNAMYLLWVAHYNNTYGGWFTPNAIFTPWNQPQEDINRYLEMAPYFLFPKVFSASMFLFLGASLLIVFIDRNKETILSRLVLLFTLIGSVAYILLFFKWDVHDYYSLALLPFPLVILATLYFRIKTIQFTSAKRIAAVLGVALISFNVFYASQHVQLRYAPKHNKNYSLVTNTKEAELMKYHSWYHVEHFRAFDNIESELNRLGITRDVKVISMPDESFQASLFMMHRKGWTGGQKDNFTKEGIKRKIDCGAQFLLINDFQRACNMGLDTLFIGTPIDTIQNILVYRLRE